MPRKATWLVIIWNALIALWVISGVSAVADSCEGMVGSRLQSCEIGQNVGGGIALFLIGLIWLVGFLITGLIWLMSRPKRRLCPSCGTSAKKGVTVCKRCGFDFRAAAGMPPVSLGPPPGWGQVQQQGPPPGWGQAQAPQPPYGWDQQQPPSGPPPGWGQPPQGPPPPAPWEQDQRR